MERITLTTEDGVKIIGDALPGRSKVPRGLLFLHMMPADRTSWREIMERLVLRGFTCLAIDLRGHGESVEKGNQTLNYKDFSDFEHQASRRDVDEGLKWLEKDQGIAPDRIGLVGASIGANLAIDALARDARLPTAVALSPGLDYRGVKTEVPVRNLQPHQSLFLAASEEDEESFASCERLCKIAHIDCHFERDAGAGHGTTMLERVPKLKDIVINWLERKIV